MSNELYEDREFLPLDYRKQMEETLAIVAIRIAHIPENIELGEN